MNLLSKIAALFAPAPIASTPRGNAGRTISRMIVIALTNTLVA